MHEENKKGDSFWDILKYAIFALIIVIPIRLFIAQPFIVSGTSMIPTLEDKDYLIVDEISYRFKNPERGEVIVFRFPYESKKFLVKRIIALPKETISITGEKVTIINSENPTGFELEEPYVKNTAKNNISVTLSENQYFVMGDNRSGSSDSRSWGPLEDKFIVGRPLIRLLPIKHIGFFPGHISKIEI